MMFEADNVRIFVLELLKQSRLGHHSELMVLLRYPDQEICVVSHLEENIEKTKDLHFIKYTGDNTCTLI